MSEKQIKIKLIENKMAETDRQTVLSIESARRTETAISQANDQIEKIKDFAKKQIAEQELKIARYVVSMENHIKQTEALVELKEKQHGELKAAIHDGEKFCEWCERYFTVKGFERHRSACASQPDKLILDEKDKKIKNDKKALAKQKKLLEKQLKELEAAEKKNKDAPIDLTKETGEE